MTITRIPGTLPEHLTRDESELSPYVDESEVTIGDGKYITDERWIVGGVFSKPRYGKPYIVTVWSPCCGKPRQGIQHGYAFSCPGCGWWWRYHELGWTNRIVSIGKNKPA